MSMAALGDSLLHTVQSCAIPTERWTKVQNSYAGRTLMNKYSALFNFIDMRYDWNPDKADNIWNLESQYTMLETIRSMFANSFKMTISISSLQECEEYSAIISSIRKMRDETARWEYVSVIVVEEYKRLNRTTKIVSKKQNTEGTVLAATQRKPIRVHKQSNSRTNKRGLCLNGRQIGIFPGNCRQADRKQRHRLPEEKIVSSTWNPNRKAACIVESEMVTGSLTSKPDLHSTVDSGV